MGMFVSLGLWSPGEQTGQGVGDAIYNRELFVPFYDDLIVRGVRIDGFVGSTGFAGEDMSRGRDVGRRFRGSGAQKSVDGVGHAFHLLDFAGIDEAELEHATIGRGEEGIMVGVEGTRTRLQLAVEEFGQVRVGMEVGFGDF